MTIIKYVDIYDTFYSDEGELTQELVRSNFMLPTIVDPNDIVNFSPYFSVEGKLFKNVSVLEDRYGKTYKVVGNYKTLNQMMDNPIRKPIGYGK